MGTHMSPSPGALEKTRKLSVAGKSCISFPGKWFELGVFYTCSRSRMWLSQASRGRSVSKQYLPNECILSYSQMSLINFNEIAH